MTAQEFTAQLEAKATSEEHKKYERFFPLSQRGEDIFIGVRMGDIFNLAKTALDMPITEIEVLLESTIHEVRAGALSIIDKQARAKITTSARQQELFDLYVRRHDRINTWDLVDLGCLYMVGNYLLDKPREILYKWAKSKNMYERRSAIVGTAYLIRKGEVEDTFKLSALLADDKEDAVAKGVGWMLRAAGDKDNAELLEFLDKNAARMNRIALRFAIEKLDSDQRKHYLSQKA